MLLFIICGFFISYSKPAFIFESYIPTCDNFINDNGEFIIARRDWKVSVGDVEIIFNLCGSVDNKICENHRACVRNANNSVACFLDEYPVSTDTSVIRSNDSKCELSIKWDCSIPEDQPTGRIINGSQYEVSLQSPSTNCDRPCGTFINTKLVDFSELKGEYVAKSKNRTLSISLCGLNPNCEFKASGCDITNKTDIIPFSSGNELVLYDPTKNMIELKKRTKYGDLEKNYDLLMKCNWLANPPILHYKQPQNQGKNYKFEMESSYGCIKLPPECKFTDNNYKFDLTKAYNKRGYWEVQNVTGSRKMFLNVCGDLRLPQGDDNNNCSISYSQICEINNGNYINRGSIYQKNKISKDKITMSIITGTKCVNDVTTIDFYCSKDEENPMLVKETNCELFLSWRTPAACPEQITGSCPKVHSGSCIYEKKSITYDLSSLLTPLGRVVKDKDNPNIEYHLNLCGPVKESEDFCKNNALVTAHHLDEYDMRKRTISFGKISEFSAEKERFIIKNWGGDFCDDEEMDRTSTITFVCSEKNSEVSLKSKGNCKLEFLWETAYFCKFPQQCLLKYPLSNQMLNLASLKKTYLKTNISGTIYLFDLCGQHKIECSPNDCTYVPVNKTWMKEGNQNYLEFPLSQNCDEKIFNKTKLELVCDKIKGNEHFIVKGREGCTLVFQLATSMACFDEDMVIPLENHESHENNVPYHAETAEVEPHSDKTTINRYCPVRNPNTGYQFNVSQLNLNISSKKCPDYAFNTDSQVVTLQYESEDECTKKTGERGQIDYRVMLKCKKGQGNYTQNGECSRNIIIEIPEACKLLPTNVLDNTRDSKRVSKSSLGGGSIAAIVATIVMIFAASSAGFWQYRRIRKRNSSYDSLATPYERNLDL